MLGILCSVSKEFEGFMIPSMDQLKVLANTLAGTNSSTPPVSSVSDNASASGFRLRGEGAYENVDDKSYIDDHGDVEELNMQMGQQQNHDRPAKVGRGRPKKVSAHKDHSYGTQRNSHQAVDPDQQSLNVEKLVALENSTAQYAPKPVAAIALPSRKRPAAMQAGPGNAKEGVCSNIPNVNKKLRDRKKVTMDGERPHTMQDGNRANPLTEKDRLYHFDYEEKIHERMLLDRKHLFLATQLQAYITRNFDADPKDIHSFVQSAMNSYTDFHVVVYLMGEVLEHFRTQHITRTGLMNVVCSIFRFAPALAVEFRSLTVKTRVASDAAEPQTSSFSSSCSSSSSSASSSSLSGAASSHVEPPPLTLRSNMGKEYTSSDKSTNMDMCVALMTQPNRATSTVGQFVMNVKAVMGNKFKFFVEYMMEARRAFSGHLYVELLACMEKVKRVLPTPFHYELDVYFPTLRAYQEYPFVRCQAMTRQQVASSSSVDERAYLMLSLHSQAQQALFIHQKQQYEHLCSDLEPRKRNKQTIQLAADAAANMEAQRQRDIISSRAIELRADIAQRYASILKFHNITAPGTDAGGETLSPILLEQPAHTMHAIERTNALTMAAGALLTTGANQKMTAIERTDMLAAAAAAVKEATDAANQVRAALGESARHRAATAAAELAGVGSAAPA